jgi:hypothetical protein
VVFLNKTRCRETAKQNATKKEKEKNDRKKAFSPLCFFANIFLHGFFSKTFGVFELPLLRNAQKYPQKIVKKQKRRSLPVPTSFRHTPLQGAPKTHTHTHMGSRSVGLHVGAHFIAYFVARHFKTTWKAPAPP